MGNKNPVIGYATGVFDLFHIGHLNLLKRARLYCDYLIVGVTTDELAFARKGKKPIFPFMERMQIVESLKCVDEVVPQEKIDEISDYENLKFDKIFKGDDWKGDPRWVDLEERFKAIGVDVFFLSYTKHTSSTKLRAILEKL